MTSLLDVRRLTVGARRGPGRLVEGVSFQIEPGETLAIVGPSGAGKTLTALAVLGLLPPGLEVIKGEAVFQDRDLLSLSSEELRPIRGRRIGAIFQDPMASLHPTMPIIDQMAEALMIHRPELSRLAAHDLAAQRIEEVEIPSARLRTSPFPFQWSGGMRQRALIAMAIAHRPALLIADEPTTALDATTQAQILDLLKRLQKELGLAMLLITHDAGVVAEMADRVVPMREGRLDDAMDQGARDGSKSPRSLRRPVDPGPEPLERLRVESVSVTYSAGVHTLRAVDDVSLTLFEGETLALVGESGCGKSSLARALTRLEPVATGRIFLDRDQDFSKAEGPALRALRSRIQIVFQDPFASLNPRRRVGDSVAEPLRIQGRHSRAEIAKRVNGLLAQVRLPVESAERFPHQLSGGERQRVAIARALASDPRVVVLDEPVSSLDASTRDEVLTLLRELQHARGLALLLIAHDLGLVRAVSDRVAVMYRGRIVECGAVEEVFERPAHPYTRALRDASLGSRRRLTENGRRP